VSIASRLFSADRHQRNLTGWNHPGHGLHEPEVNLVCDTECLLALEEGAVESVLNRGVDVGIEGLVLRPTPGTPRVRG
jgi:hypothetical protein